MATKVKNRKGSGDEKCSTCGSWLRHWENGTGEKKAICGAVGCNGTPVLGGHVVKSASSDDRSHITPICAACNAKSEEYEVVWGLYLAADKSRCKA